MGEVHKLEKFGLTYGEAADYSGASVRKLAEEIKLKKLVAYKPGREVQIPKEELDKWIKKTRLA